MSLKISRKLHQKWDPKKVKSEIATLRQFLPSTHFFSFFWPFMHFLGVSWEPYWASWGSLGRPLDPKTYKNSKFFKVFEKALWSSWWPSWAHLGPSWADMVLKWAPKWVPKVFQTVIKKFSKNDPKNEPILGPILGPKNSQNLDRLLKAFSTVFLIFVSFFWGFGALWVPLGSFLGPKT